MHNENWEEPEEDRREEEEEEIALTPDYSQPVRYPSVYQSSHEEESAYWQDN
jgi:hypothetical protein